VQHILAHHAGAQQQGQQLGIPERSGAMCNEFLARMRTDRQVLERHGLCGLMGPSLK
jgi:hypothetical protein